MTVSIYAEDRFGFVHGMIRRLSVALFSAIPSLSSSRERGGDGFVVADHLGEALDQWLCRRASGSVGVNW